MLINKVLYKTFLIALKYIPIVITICYILNTLLAYFNVDISVISYIAGISILTWLFLYISSFVFNFCIYHRICLYYILLIDILNLIDYHYNLPINDFNLMVIHTILLGLFILLILIKYVTNYKKTSLQNH